MSFSITISGDTYRELTDKISFLADHLTLDSRLAEAATEQSDLAGAEPTRKRGPGRPRKTPITNPTIEQVADTATVKAEPAEVDPLGDTPLAESKEMTMDDAKDAGRLVLANKGVEALREVLKKFAVNKVADLKQPQFETFIKTCFDTAA